jgi:hypothetical protein
MVGVNPDPCAIVVLFTACSTDTKRLDEAIVRLGSNGEHETVAGTTIRTPD